MLTALKSARLNGVPFRVRRTQTEKERDSKRENKTEKRQTWGREKQI